MTDCERRFQFEIDGLQLQLMIEVPGEIAEIPPVVDRIMEVVRKTSCAKGDEFDVEVALNEALANAVEHGCGHDPKKQIQVCVACEPNRGMLIIVRDPGSGFNPEDVPSPIIGRNVFANSGRGIFLINQLMDEVRFERGGTEIWMAKTPKK